jgi:rhomboid protease GluP
MELDEVLALVVALGSGMLLVRLFRDGWRGNWGWKFLSFVLGATGAASWLFEPRGGVPSAAAWFALVLVPLAINRRVNRAILEQRFGAARKLARLGRWLHPVDGFWQQPVLIEALELAHKGEVERATAILEPFRARRTPLATLATLQIFRLRGAWEELLVWVRGTFGEEIATRDANFATVTLRALGETGDLNGLVSLHARQARLLESPNHAGSQTLARLMVFAFTGDAATTERILSSSLAGLPAATREFWLATAEIAGGQGARAKERLESASRSGDAIVRKAVERRLTQALGSPSELTKESRAALDAMRVAWDQEERYGTTKVLPRGALRGVKLVLAANLIVFLAEAALGGLKDEESLLKAVVRLGALVPERVLAGEWWRVPAAMFLHFGLVHLALNMLGLIALGRMVEATLRTKRFLLVYALSGLGSMLACTFFYAAHGRGSEPVVGASGAIMGLVGAAAAIALRGWWRERARVARRQFFWVLTIVALQSGLDLAIPEVSFTGHMSGTILGFLVAALLHHEGTSPHRGPHLT